MQSKMQIPHSQFLFRFFTVIVGVKQTLISLRYFNNLHERRACPKETMQNSIEKFSETGSVMDTKGKKKTYNENLYPFIRSAIKLTHAKETLAYVSLT